MPARSSNPFRGAWLSGTREASTSFSPPRSPNHLHCSANSTRLPTTRCTACCGPPPWSPSRPRSTCRASPPYRYRCTGTARASPSGCSWWRPTGARTSCSGWRRSWRKPSPGSTAAPRCAREDGRSPVVAHELLDPCRLADLSPRSEGGYVRLDVENRCPLDGVEPPYLEHKGVDAEKLTDG